MIYAGIDVNIISHARAFLSGPEAMGLWVWSMCYAQVHETDGRVPRAAALAAWGGKRNVMLAKKLVESGLWLAREDGDWDIWNYDKKNQSADEIRRKKDAARDRKERWKERKQNANGTRSETFPERDGTPLPPPPSPPLHSLSHSPPPISLGPDGDSGSAFGAWQQGIRAVTGKPVSALSPNERRDLVDLVNGHAEGRKGEPLMVWISETAEVWARQHDPRFGGFKPSQCKTWLDAGRPARASSVRGAEITKQPFDPNAPWLKLPEVG